MFCNNRLTGITGFTFDPVPVLFHICQPSFGAAPRGQTNAVRPVGQPAMCPRPDADPVLRAPVNQIMATGRIPARIVRYLIAMQSGGLHDLTGHLIEIGSQIIISHKRFTSPGARKKPCARFDCQLIQRHVIKTDING